MICVRLKGGMGNQMFQYALGLQLAENLNTNLKLDVSNLLYRNKGEDFVYRNYDLDVFRIEPSFLARPQVLAPLFNLRVKPLGKLLRKLVAGRYPVVEEPHFHFAPELLDQARQGVLYEGWFQSPKYFAGVEDQVRKAFTYRHELIPESRDLLARIESSNAVCLNVRRTDFLTTDVLNATDEAFFQRGVRHVREHVESPQVFVFSDDIEWCRENLKFSVPTEFVGHEHKGFKFGNYLRLMQSCKHFVIPNSSFAWWAAWLNTRPGKIVVAPKMWFTDPGVDTSDLVPGEWVRL